ncbi:MAG: hypothetical protein R2704_17425 [Microthrixaceae bacterium]
MEPPDPAVIEVDPGGGRLNLAERVGNLDERIRGHVIRIAEEMVAETEIHRRFDGWSWCTWHCRRWGTGA